MLAVAVFGGFSSGFLVSRVCFGFFGVVYCGAGFTTDCGHFVRFGGVIWFWVRRGF